MKVKYLVPPIYKDFFPASVWNADTREQKATCEQCIQAPQKYKTDLKCCTFWPFIPNYLVGQILLSTDQKYKRVQSVIRDHISKRNYTLPMGLMAPGEYQQNFRNRKAQIFGRDQSFLCPYYNQETANCGVWLYRGSVCTSFYCESSFGKKGQTFWHRFENYLSYLEMGISQEVLAYKDYSPRDVTDQLEYLNAQEGKKITHSKYKKIWKHFYGDEVNFYIQSAYFVESMPKKQIQEIIGQTGEEIKILMVESLSKIV